MTINEGELNQTHWSQYEASPYDKSMSETTSIVDLGEAVYGDNLFARRYALSNPLLTLEHFNFLYPLYKDSTLVYFLMKNRSCPANLLYKIAVEDGDPVVRKMASEHPNITEESLVIITLRKDPTYEATQADYETYKLNMETFRGLA